jgi:hypothetical protein
MDRAELAERLARTEMGTESLDHLAEDLLAEVRGAGRVATSEYLLTRNPVRVETGMGVLERIRELSLSALAAVKSTQDPQLDVWVIRLMTDEYLDLRKRVLVELTALFLNRSRLDSVPGTLALSDMRVCDLAYLLVRRLAKLGDAADFLNRPTIARDKMIRELAELDIVQTLTDSER